MKVGYFICLRYCQPHIVGHIDGEHLVAQRLAHLATTSCKECDAARKHRHRSADKHPAAHLLLQLHLAYDVLRSQIEQRQIYHKYGYHRGVDVGQQLASLARVGGREVKKHIGSHNRIAKQIG